MVANFSRVSTMNHSESTFNFPFRMITLKRIQRSILNTFTNPQIPQYIKDKVHKDKLQSELYMYIKEEIRRSIQYLRENCKQQGETKLSKDIYR